jgi:phosphatidylethanolamine-binding protein (PEBP) family uncharacterized protein
VTRWLFLVLAAVAPACGGGTTAPSTTPPSLSQNLVLQSAAFPDGGTLPARYVCAARTGLGVDTNPPLSWTGAPATTSQFVLLMSTVANDATGTVTKYNWVLYQIPAAASSIPENNTVIASGTSGVTGVGVAGLTSDGPLLSYSAPCSAAGSGRRTYTFTLYAVSAAPVFAFNRVPGAGGDGANLAAALPPITVARSSISASYVF